MYRYQYLLRLFLLFMTCSLIVNIASCANESHFNSTNSRMVNTDLNANAATSPDAHDTMTPKKDASNNTETNVRQSDSVDISPIQAAPTNSVDASAISSTKDVTPNKKPVESFKASFPTSTKLAGNMTLNLADSTLSTEIELKNQYGTETKSFNQIDRPMQTKTFKQGNPGMTKNENFSQTNRGVVDIELVIDDSNSMQQEQDRVKTKLNDLLMYIDNSDWQINISTTDPDQPGKCSRDLIKKGEANIQTRFSAAVAAGINGSGNERGILMAVKGFQCPNANNGNWVRANSSVAVLIVSDEDNCSNNGSDCPGTAYNTSSYLTNYLANTLARPLGQKSRVYGIFWIPGTTCLTGFNQATQYMQAVTATSGKAGSICDADYTSTLQAISQDITTILETQFVLQATPDLNSDVVTVNGTTQKRGVDYTLTGTTLKFLTVPPYAATILVSYTVGAAGTITNSFPLGETPAPNTLSVYVNDVLVDPTNNQYSVSADNKLVFTSAPQSAANIKAIFKSNLKMLTQFQLNANLINDPNTTKIQINNVETKDYTIDDKGLLTLNTTPPDNATISATYSYLIGPITSYNLTLVGNTITNFKITDSATGTPFDAKVSNGVLIVAPTAFKAGLKIKVTYSNEMSGVIKTTLPQTPAQDSLMVTSTDGSCTFNLKGTMLEIDCSSAAAQTVTVKWTYLTDPLTKFTLDQVTHPDIGRWTVLIDDAETKDFTRDGKIITLTQTPATSSVITLSYRSAN